MLTLVFASHNGADTLPTMLDSLTRLEAPQGGWKLVAVDNASTDATPEILEQFADRLPLHILRHRKLGKSRALNAALDHVEGEVVVFTDDDVVVRPDWLKQYHWIGRRAKNFAVFAGAVAPRWPEPVSQAILEGIPLAPAFAIHPDRPHFGPADPIMFWGPNMAVRREAIDQGHRFNEAIGPIGANYPMGNDTEFATRLRDAGFNCLFDSRILVEHLIQPHQLTLKWLMGRAFRHGRRGFQKDRDASCANGADFAAHPNHRLAEMLARSGRVAAAGLMGDRTGLYRACWQLQHLRGWRHQARLEG